MELAGDGGAAANANPGWSAALDVTWLIVSCLVGGVIVSCLAERLPLDTAHAELLGGLLLVCGLVLLGNRLSVLFH